MIFITISLLLLVGTLFTESSYTREVDDFVQEEGQIPHEAQAVQAGPPHQEDADATLLLCKFEEGYTNIRD